METEEHAPGRWLDRHGDVGRGVVLLWHGRQPDSRAAARPLAEEVAARGLVVLNADWSSEASDHGRSDLLTSVRHARTTAQACGLDPDRLVVVGWSLGGTAAASLAVHAKRLGIGLGGAVLVAPGDGPRAVDGLSGAPLPARFPRGDARVAVAYGEHDTIATPDLVTGLEQRLRAAGWATTLHAVDADHDGVVAEPGAVSVVADVVDGVVSPS